MAAISLREALSSGRKEIIGQRVNRGKRARATAIPYQGVVACKDADNRQ